jgi:hypothetical protein
MKYYAKGIDIDGNEINLPVDTDGNLYCINKKLVSLESNATYVSCWNNRLSTLNLPNAAYVDCEYNCLTELNLPEAMYVSCRDNCLTVLNLPKATSVDCEHNKLTELNLPTATLVYCDNTGLKDILNLILDRAINGSELKMSIRIR